MRYMTSIKHVPESIPVAVQSQTPEMAKNAVSGVVACPPDANPYEIMNAAG